MFHKSLFVIHIIPMPHLFKTQRIKKLARDIAVYFVINGVATGVMGVTGAPQSNDENEITKRKERTNEYKAEGKGDVEGNMTKIEWRK